MKGSSALKRGDPALKKRAEWLKAASYGVELG
jgi:hypothetical protein